MWFAYFAITSNLAVHTSLTPFTLDTLALQFHVFTHNVRGTLFAFIFCLLVGAFWVDLLLFEYLINNHMVSAVLLMRILHVILVYDSKKPFHVFITISIYV